MVCQDMGMAAKQPGTAQRSSTAPMKVASRRVVLSTASPWMVVARAIRVSKKALEHGGLAGEQPRLTTSAADNALRLATESQLAHLLWPLAPHCAAIPKASEQEAR